MDQKDENQEFKVLLGWHCSQLADRSELTLSGGTNMPQRIPTTPQQKLQKLSYYSPQSQHIEGIT